MLMLPNKEPEELMKELSPFSPVRNIFFSLFLCDANTETTDIEIVKLII